MYISMSEKLPSNLFLKTKIKSLLIHWSPIWKLLSEHIIKILTIFFILGLRSKRWSDLSGL